MNPLDLANDHPSAARATAPHRWQRGRALLLPALLLLAWEWASHRDAAMAYAFTPIETVLATLWGLLRGADLWINVEASLARTLAGFVAGVAGGIACGALMARSRLAARAIGPIYHLLRQVPLLGLIPLISLWFGTGELAKTLVIVLASFYPVVLNTFEGLSGVDPRHLEVAALLDLGPWRRLTRVLLPAALPSILTGVLQALPFAWVSAVASELLFTAGAGLGGMILNAQAGARMDVIVVAVLAVTALAALMNALCIRISRRFARPSSR
ncbi:ABC transporter permease [Paraburkholderia lycopersici]|uniref:Sulfonate transport system permease protein n=1 Tax=Paraburkholderia lycopersici TaxID=416944 RepID=A0A1G6HAH5_9BURK|nr:ABC transporter permease [Paraburkholderia lycopersici]SDB91221.1 sulfonate transport system permease protein [Paraburkholderia lycopersici]